MPIGRRSFAGAAILLVAACGGASSTDLNDPAGPGGGGVGTDGGGGGGGLEGGVTPGPEGGVPDSGMPLVCKQGTADCDGLAKNGCEVNTLIDDAHCGGCDPKNACASGSSCQAGACVVGPVTIVPPNTLMAGDAPCLAVDVGFVYVSAGKANGDVYRVAKSGGTVTSIATNQANPRGIAADGSDVFWGLFTSGIVTVAKADGSNPKSVNGGNAVAGVNTVTVDNQGVYWGNNQVGTVTRADKSGGKLKQLVPAAAGTSLGAGHVGGIAVSGTFVYYGDPTDGEVWRVPSDGSAPPSLVADNVPGARAVAVTGNTVLFTSASGGGQVFAVAASGPPALPMAIASGQGLPVSVTTDGAAAYWANSGNAGTIMKKAAGGAPVTLASAQPFPTCVVVDGASLYWVNQFGASVMRVAK